MIDIDEEEEIITEWASSVVRNFYKINCCNCGEKGLRLDDSVHINFSNFPKRFLSFSFICNKCNYLSKINLQILKKEVE